MVLTLSEQEMNEMDPHWCLVNLHYTHPRYQHAKEQTVLQRTGCMMSEAQPGRERWLFEHRQIRWFKKLH
jgi:hypothetical protein